MDDIVDIREVIEPANFSLIKGLIKTPKELIEKGLDEFRAYDFEDVIGKPCYYLYDNCRNYIREVYVGDTFTKNKTLDVIDDLDIFMFDLYFRDVVDNFIKDKEKQEELYKSEDYVELYNYLKENDTKISQWEFNVIEIMAIRYRENIKEFND